MTILEPKVTNKRNMTFTCRKCVNFDHKPILYVNNKKRVYMLLVLF